MRSLNTSDLTAKCIQCGFCLESCPTFTETGLETKSPRGRIQLVKAAEEGTLRWGDLAESLDSCLGCRACETACPSGVAYGEILERARVRLLADNPNAQADRLLRLLTRPGLLRLALAASSLAPPALVRSLTGGFDPPTPQPRETWPPLEGVPNPTKNVRLLGGCVMPVVFARAREATIRLLRRCGASVEVVSACCGALHAHQGHLAEGEGMRDRLPRDLVTDVAGCGSWLRDARPETRDITEVLVDLGLIDLLRECDPLRVRVAYHDACHLAHGQGVRNAPRELLAAIPGLVLVPLAESDTCCGSAGIYNVLQPEMARRLLARKWANIVAADVDVVVMGNAGCQAWLSSSATVIPTEEGSRFGPTYDQSSNSYEEGSRRNEGGSLRPLNRHPEERGTEAAQVKKGTGGAQRYQVVSRSLVPRDDAPCSSQATPMTHSNDASVSVGEGRRQVASGPGEVRVMHAVELLEAAFSGMPEGDR